MREYSDEYSLRKLALGVSPVCDSFCVLGTAFEDSLKMNHIHGSRVAMLIKKVMVNGKLVSSCAQLTITK